MKKYLLSRKGKIMCHYIFQHVLCDINSKRSSYSNSYAITMTEENTRISSSIPCVQKYITQHKRITGVKKAKKKLSHKRQMTLLGQNHAHPVFKNRTFERMHTFLRPLPRISPITAAL